MTNTNLNPNTETMNLTKVATTFPALANPSIKRDNLISTLLEMLRADTEVVTVEGPDGIGKTTLLAQFALEHPQHTFSLFVRSSSRWAYDSGMLTRDLCDQIGWVLFKEKFRNPTPEPDPFQLYRKRLSELHSKANYERTTYFFVIDGLSEIPEEDRNEREMILKLLPFGLRPFRFILSASGDTRRKNFGNIGVTSTFRMAGFTFEETREFLADLVEDRRSLQTIYRVSKNPGNLASIRRLLQGGENIDRLIEELPAHLPHLFDLEWRAIDPQDSALCTGLAVLAFDRRKHSIHSLSRICKAAPAELTKKLTRCRFMEIRKDGQEVEFVCEVFKRFVSEKLQPIS